MTDRSTATPRTAVVLPFRRCPDEVPNAVWDRLVEQSCDAWTWRDPESLDALERTLEEIRGLVAREWRA